MGKESPTIILTVKDDSCAFKNELPYQISKVVNTRFFLLEVHVSSLLKCVNTYHTNCSLTFENLSAITVF